MTGVVGRSEEYFTYTKAVSIMVGGNRAHEALDDPQVAVRSLHLRLEMKRA